MKKYWFLLFAALIVVGSGGIITHPSFAGDDLVLTQEKNVDPPAGRINVQKYEIIPGSDAKIIIHFDWMTTGGQIIRDATMFIEGQDYVDVMQFNIRAQDVGTPIGQGLKQLVWNKIKALYGIEFQ